MTFDVAMANLGLAQATVATLGAVMVIGLGFLHRPSKASLLWSLAFVLAMTSTWVSVTGSALGDEQIRRAGLGLMLGAPALIWSGFRARRGVPALPWIAVAQALITAGGFLVASASEVYGLAFRVGFFGASVFAGLTLLELRRAADRQERLVLPLTIVSGGFVALGCWVLLSGLLLPVRADDLELTRVLNGLAMLVFLVCAIVSLLYFTSVSPVGTLRATSWPQFSVTARDRLRRARRAHEPGWAVLAIRIDDADHVRGAAGEASWGRIVEAFEDVVATTLPAEADLGSPARGRVVAVVCRPGPVLREHVREMLRRVTELDATSHIAVQLSASVGWVPAESGSYDLDVLAAAADGAAAQASRLGGDRWERLDA
ncbi:hypothetical protein [Microbacterium sp. LMI1-1-1.1]|uniref:hypothetical protein n=1 Tax=Microbacterium sp. LMI1-1-1.1 TaxID=3135223 RepID=UPI0034650E3F